MKLRYLRAFIVLLAGLVTLLINMKTHKDVTLSLLTVLIVIIVFYVIATLIVEILQRSFETNDSGSFLVMEESDEDGEKQGTEEPLFDEE